MNASTFRIISHKAKVGNHFLFYHANLEGEKIHSNDAIKMPENVQQPQNHGSLCNDWGKNQNAKTYSCEKERCVIKLNER